MKILVYGAGVTGSYYAAQLEESGQEVSILARGQRLADIRDHGIVLEDGWTGQRMVTRVNVVEQLRPEDAYDWVLVLMRKNQVSAVLPVLAANSHTPNTVFLMNNAAGPAELIQGLGYDRVLLGFPGTGGVREGHVIRYIAGRAGRQATATIGELDGRITPRLQQLAKALQAAGFGVNLEPHMNAWLKTHVALVSPMANALYMAGGDNYRLARTRDALVLMIRAMCEGFHVLRELDMPIRPPVLAVLQWIPEPVLVALLQRLLSTSFAEIGIAGHANAARDEMKHLADEFQALALSTAVPTPAIDRLYEHIDLTVPPIRPGSARIPMDWRGVWIGLGALAALAAFWKLRPRGRR